MDDALEMIDGLNLGDVSRRNLVESISAKSEALANEMERFVNLTSETFPVHSFYELEDIRRLEEVGSPEY